MTVRVMHVRYVRVGMSQRPMFVKMRVRLSGWIEGAVGVAVVFIVHVRMRVSHRLVNVLMLVTLSQVQPNSDCHEGTGNGELHSKRLAKRDNRRHSAEKWRGREVCAGPRGSKVS